MGMTGERCDTCRGWRIPRKPRISSPSHQPSHERCPDCDGWVLYGGALLHGGDIARIMGVSRAAVRYWVGMGKLRSSVPGLPGGYPRYRPQDVEDLIAAVGESSPFRKPHRRKVAP